MQYLAVNPELMYKYIGAEVDRSRTIRINITVLHSYTQLTENIYLRLKSFQLSYEGIIQILYTTSRREEEYQFYMKYN